MSSWTSPNDALVDRNVTVRGTCTLDFAGRDTASNPRGVWKSRSSSGRSPSWSNSWNCVLCCRTTSAASTNTIAQICSGLRTRWPVGRRGSSTTRKVTKSVISTAETGAPLVLGSRGPVSNWDWDPGWALAPSVGSGAPRASGIQSCTWTRDSRLSSGRSRGDRPSICRTSSGASSRGGSSRSPTIAQPSTASRNRNPGGTLSSRSATSRGNASCWASISRERSASTTSGSTRGARCSSTKRSCWATGTRSWGVGLSASGSTGYRGSVCSGTLA